MNDAKDIEAMKDEMAGKAKELAMKAADFAREQPHVAVGIAFGVGWVLGNGLPPRVILGAARLGWKALLGGALAGSGFMGILGGEEEPEPPPSPARKRARASADHETTASTSRG